MQYYYSVMQNTMGTVNKLLLRVLGEAAKLRAACVNGRVYNVYT